MNSTFLIRTMFCILAISVLAACSLAPAQTERDDAVHVTVVPVVAQELPRPIRLSGKLASKAELKLSFKIGGFVRKINVDEGQLVRKGQVMARLDLQEIEAKVNQARSIFKKAERDLERVKNLYNDNALTLENYQDAQTGLDISRSNLKVAEYNLRHATIKAPANGKILRRFVETNELIGPGIPVFLFGSSDKDWIVRLGVTDRDIIRISIDDPVNIEFDAYPGLQFQGKVSEIAETDDPRTGLFEVEASLSATDLKLVSGFVARGLIVPEKRHTYTVIPIESLVEGNGNTGSVFILDENEGLARKTSVGISHIFKDKVALLHGLEPGMQVITAGSQYLIDGSSVRVFSQGTVAQPADSGHSPVDLPNGDTSNR